jgi:hypothetical protein
MAQSMSQPSFLLSNNQLVYVDPSGKRYVAYLLNTNCGGFRTSDVAKRLYSIIAGIGKCYADPSSSTIGCMINGEKMDITRCDPAMIACVLLLNHSAFGAYSSLSICLVPEVEFNSFTMDEHLGWEKFADGQNELVKWLVFDSADLTKVRVRYPLDREIKFLPTHDEDQIKITWIKHDEINMVNDEAVFDVNFVVPLLNIKFDIDFMRALLGIVLVPNKEKSDHV